MLIDWQKNKDIHAYGSSTEGNTQLLLAAAHQPLLTFPDSRLPLFF